MKRMLLFLVCILLFSGCALGDTPTSRVEEFLSAYQRLDGNVSLSYDQLSSDKDINEDLKDDYQELIERQYKNLAYEVKEEMVDGRKATVTVQVKVYDYKEVIDKYNKDDYVDKRDYHDVIINRLEEQKDKLTYTIDFELFMNDNDEWEMLELDLNSRNKLLGIY